MFERESTLYADVVGNENADPVWNSPIWERIRISSGQPISFRVVEALEAFGIFTVKGLRIRPKVWGEHDVEGKVEWSLTRDLYPELARRLDVAGLITKRATDEHAGTLSHTWQLPMYNMDFAKISVPLEDLQEQRAANVPSEY